MKYFIFLLLIPSVLSVGVYPQELSLKDSVSIYLSSSKNSSVFLESDVLDVPEEVQILEGVTILDLKYKKRGAGHLIIKENGVNLFLPVIVENSFRGGYIFIIINFLGLLLGGFFWKKKHFFQ